MHIALRHTAAPDDTRSRPLVLIHGLGSDPVRDFEDTGLLKQIRRSDREIILVTLPGHPDPRKSTPSADIATLPAGESVGTIQQAIVSGVRARVGERCVDIVAHSLGARLAWNLQAMGLAVGRVVLDGLASQEPFTAVNQDVLREAVSRPGRETDPVTGMVADVLRRVEGGDTDQLVALISALAATPFDPAQAPTAPTLVVAGRDDPIAGSPAWAMDRLEQGHVLVVPGDHEGALASAEYRNAAVDFLG